MRKSFVLLERVSISMLQLDFVAWSCALSRQDKVGQYDGRDLGIMVAGLFPRPCHDNA